MITRAPARPGEVFYQKRRHVRRKEYVHGLVVLTPLKDYDFAYLLAALDAYETVSIRRGNRQGVFWSQHLRKKLRPYFAMLVRETKRENHRLREAPLVIPLSGD